MFHNELTWIEWNELIKSMLTYNHELYEIKIVDHGML